MLLYLDLAYERWKSKGKMSDLGQLAAAVHHGAVQRIRPKAMTVATTFIALLPILWATGTGSDVMRRIAAPMIGGIVSSFAGELIVYPALYFIWRSVGLRSSGKAYQLAGERID
jgi:Cu(I)/Ag(I) efflux system membrane protein CusA/SilA